MNKITRRRYLASPLSEFLGSVVIVALLVYGGNLVLSGSNSLSASSFMAYIAVFSQILTPAKSFSTAFYHVQKGLASYDRINEIINIENTIKEPEHPSELSEFESGIEYKNVSFAYKDKPVLNNINLSIKKGETVALVGQSGSGKSTFVDLLLRFYDVQSGQITLDGVDIKKFKISSLRNLLGYVHQEALLFNESFKKNIAFGANSIDNEKLIQVAKIAHAEEFIQEKDEGMNWNIGDRGNKLSGGQKQRISIARALYADPQILILDEATSALDSESERLVQDALDKLMKNRTTIVVAHRLSTIINADQIAVFKNGKIVETGKHSELLEKKGEYLKIYSEASRKEKLSD